MMTPERLKPLIHAGLIDDVVGQLQSGKEAEVYIVTRHGEYLCAKIYKESHSRSFKHKTKYTEGRKIRGSRRARAMEGKSKYGRMQNEVDWHNTEVDALRLLAAAGVRVPRTFEYFEGVLLLEMIVGSDGQPASRLTDVKLSKEEALEYFNVLMRQVVLMLVSGIVHGDFSEFNVLVSKDGLVIIDLPQAVQSTANNAFEIFDRDIAQLKNFFGRMVPEVLETNYAMEIWTHYKNGTLRPNTKLTGLFEFSKKIANVTEVMELIDAAREDEMKRRLYSED